MKTKKILMSMTRRGLLMLAILTLGMSQVNAALRSDWTLITAANQITAGGTYIIAYNSGTASTHTAVVPMRNETNAEVGTSSGSTYIYSGTSAGSSGTGTINMENSALDLSAYQVTIVAGSSNGSFAIQLSDGNYVGFYGTSNNNVALYSSVVARCSFTIEENSTTDKFKFCNVNSTSRYFKYGTSGRFSNYASNSGSTGWVVIYKKTGKTYHEWDGSSSFSTSAGGATLKTVPSLCDWAIEPYGWCSQSNYASSSYPTGKIWFKDASWPDGITDLYALYRVGSSPYYYSTKPTIYTITYSLTNASKDDSYTYVCTSDMVDEVGTSSFEAYFKPASGYMLDESCISITMGGSPVSSNDYYWDPEYSYPEYDYTAQLWMENITGNVVVTVTAKVDCSNSVTIATGSPTNCTISASAASVLTCSGSRQVTISVTPNSCYAAPVKASVTSTGTTATWVSGPTLNSGHYDYVYSFAENATGTTTFNCSLSTKTTYTVSYAAGATTCTGGNAISGSHANDTKTCGTSMPLPAASFTTTGYTQTGWSKTSCGSQYAAVGGNYTDNAAQTFYPVWTADVYTVTWKVNNGDYSAGGSSSVTYGNHISTLPTAPNPASYCGDVFVGWTTDENYVHNTSPLYTTVSGFPNATGNQVFYAVFADYVTP